MKGSMTILVSVGLFSGLAGCHADEGGFYDQIFPCQRGSLTDPCGPARDGKPMVCFAGDQFGDGADFCAERCDPAVPPDHDFVCASSGALLRFCKPSVATPDPGTGCPQGLQCYRTGLLGDKGVCLAMKVCNDNSQCDSSQSHRTCGATLLREVVSAAAAKVLGADHLSCLQKTCSSTTMDCPSGEICLANFSYRPAAVPDICAPQCDNQGHCPPGFGCDRTSASPGDPPVCIPGLPGARCSSDLDCQIGTCVDTGAGFSTCALQCDPKGDPCASMDFSDHLFVCVESVPGGGFHCMSPNPFAGSLCASDVDCAAPQKCSFYSASLAGVSAQGECRSPCDNQGRCPARGGLPHVCLAGGQGGCHPGNFGLPCFDSSECLPGLTCEALVADARYPTGASICTLPCPASGNCDDEPLTAQGGFCSQRDGFCHLAGASGTLCVRDVECSSRHCNLPAQGSGACAASNGG